MSTFTQRLMDAPRHRVIGLALGGLVMAQVVTGTALAHADGPPSDAIAKVASAEAHGEPRSVSKVTAEQVLRLAESQVGISEDSAGGGTKFQAWYMASPRAQQTIARDTGKISDYANAAWCDMFVSWVGEQLGIQDTMGQDAYTVQHAKWFEAQGRWGTAPKPGAVVFFDWNGGGIDGIDHVGFVVQDNGDGTIKTVEGNTGNGVVEIRTRPTYQVAGYGYPSYAAA
ncbi:CHAP domain-containing protein [Sphaerisporangium aureirubrum]|uniref:CHAP domain-containing protein n=1 Tax=Sphaerisporangium aureirubrum TaxID=1544736 RepID=A0ABW1NDL7_9ACTN